jgi:hypothetical protein
MYNILMFIFSLLIGIYSYWIFFLGIIGLLYKPVIYLSTTIFFCLGFLIWKNVLLAELKKFFYFIRNNKKIHKLFFTLLILFIMQVCVNVIGTFGSELAFDALWYHLTLPKLFLLQHKIFYIPGGLLYYSVMPKLGEMLYIGGLSFGNEVIAKFIHFSFGLLTCLALYKFARIFFTPLISFLAVVIFYSNLVVAWESITAYVDLVRTFFELMALWGFINWWNSQKRKWFVLSAIMIGFAITTKLLGIGSLVIYLLLIAAKILCPEKSKEISWEKITVWHKIFQYRFTLLKMLKNLLYLFIVLIVPLPWLIFSYINTGNPVFPFFTSLYPVSASGDLVNPIRFFNDIWILFTHAADPISPIYLILFPLIVMTYPKFKKEIKIIVWYCILSVFVWYVTPRTGGGRFILPYLPAFSLVSAACINEIIVNKKRYHNYYPKLLIALVIFISIISIGYRFFANKKYLPVEFGMQTKDQFLSQQLYFSYGDFYDIDSYFKTHMKQNDRVLLYGFHNLYYVNFPFVDASWVKEGDRFTYIATQKQDLPEKYNKWKLIYKNDTTMIKLYRLP